MPVTNISILTLSVTAAAAALEGQPISYDGNIVANGAAMHGIAETDAEAGSQLAITVLGTGAGIAGGVIAKGAQVQVTGGKFVTLAGGTPVGRALQAAAADGDKFELMPTPS